MARAIMLQGTGSDVGKSLLVAGLARACARRGLRVRPFKPQNMSNNAAVTAEGGEIGRAQALQARACGVAPSVDMNPILLKPQSEVGAQVVLRGRILGNTNARDYQAMKPDLLAEVVASFERLAANVDLVLVEGAGSPAEINLRDGDIANMGFAQAADLPVVLIGDIDRGGVIAQLVGTHAVLAPADRERIAGFLVNKFRGDPALFATGRREIATRTGWRDLGLVPWFAEAWRLPAEDAVALDSQAWRRAGDGRVRIAVPRLPGISNFDDLDPLRAEPEVALDIVTAGRALPGDADLVILPGSKSTISDLAMLRAQGWDIDIQAHRRRDGAVLGICGGLQMLGAEIADPLGIEGPAGSVAGLGLLSLRTELGGDKRLAETRGADRTHGRAVHGYFMHVGRTAGGDLARPMLDLDGGPDGATSPDGRVMGCYLHGLFAADDFRRAFLASLGAREAGAEPHESRIEDGLDRLAAHLGRAVDLEVLLSLSDRARARAAT